jgi:cytochrome c peroxidase
MNNRGWLPRLLAGTSTAVVLASCQEMPTQPHDVAVSAARMEQVAPKVSALLISGSGLPFSEELAELGDMIFDDENLSLNRNQSCATCHSAEWGFTGPDKKVNREGAVYEGSIPNAFGDRKPPSSAYSTLSPVFSYDATGGLFVGGNFADGRATGEKLGNPAADQAQGPFLNPVEQALPDAACVVYLVSRAPYVDEYVEQWGSAILDIAFPSNTDSLCRTRPATVPLSQSDRDAVEQEFGNIAISIAVYEESHNLFTSKFDAVRQGRATFTAQEQLGLSLFDGKGMCSQCHTSSGNNPAFTDFTYDNLGVPKNPENPVYRGDPAYIDHGLGAFLSTRNEWQHLASGEMGKIKVPTLRNVDLRPNGGDVKAYMHNGVFKSLEEVVSFYNTRDVLPECAPRTPRAQWGKRCWPAPEVGENVNDTELGNLGLSRAEEGALVAFLRTLSDGFTPSPRGKKK